MNFLYLSKVAIQEDCYNSVSAGVGTENVQKDNKMLMIRSLKEGHTEPVIEAPLKRIGPSMLQMFYYMPYPLV